MAPRRQTCDNTIREAASLPSTRLVPSCPLGRLSAPSCTTTRAGSPSKFPQVWISEKCQQWMQLTATRTTQSFISRTLSVATPPLRRLIARSSIKAISARGPHRKDSNKKRPPFWLSQRPELIYRQRVVQYPQSWSRVVSHLVWPPQLSRKRRIQSWDQAQAV